MGHRTLKRVSLDFQWPLGEAWKGYLNPYPGPEKCSACDGTGYNPETNRIADTFYDFEDTGERWCDHITQEEVQALVDDGRLRVFTHYRDPEKGWVKKDPPYIPTADEVNNWNQRAFGHDAINRHILIEARAKRLGVWGKCEVCHGKGEISIQDPEARKRYEEWESYEPPSGDGWQLWETTTEGSPSSPVFASAEELAEFSFTYYPIGEKPIIFEK